MGAKHYGKRRHMMIQYVYIKNGGYNHVYTAGSNPTICRFAKSL